MAEDSQIEARVFRKVASRLIPLIAVSYLIAYVDRTNLNFASVSMNAQLGFSQAVYGAGASLFFASYALFEVPSNVLLQRFGARRWLARIMVTWGLVSMAIVLVKAPWHFYLLRFLLGMAEAGFFPGVAHYLADWMPARRRARAISLFYIAVPAGTAVMGALSTPLLALDGRLGLAGWQWLLLLEGLPAVAMGVVLLFALPDAPTGVRWLSPTEKDWLATRLAKDAEASGPSHGSLLSALGNPIVLAIGLADLLMFGVNNAINFSIAKMMVGTGGFTMAMAGTTATVAGLLCVVTMLLVGQVADRTPMPFTLKAALAGSSALGVALLWAGGPSILTPIGYILFYVSAISSSMMMAVIVSRFVHPSGRAAGIAMANTLAQAGGFAGPLLWGIAADRSGGFSLGLAIAMPLPLVAAAIILFAGILRQRAVTAHVVGAA